MIDSLLIGSLVILVNMGIQCVVVVSLILYLIKKDAMKAEHATLFTDILIILIVVSVLFMGHILQFGVWAQIFVIANEFPDLATAFYHSIVNFSSLGYGDLVMSEKWRMLGALEACNGVLMFGLSTGTILAIMSQLLKRHENGDTHQQ